MLYSYHYWVLLYHQNLNSKWIFPPINMLAVILSVISVYTYWLCEMTLQQCLYHFILNGCFIFLPLLTVSLRTGRVWGWHHRTLWWRTQWGRDSGETLLWHHWYIQVHNYVHYVYRPTKIILLFYAGYCEEYEHTELWPSSGTLVKYNFRHVFFAINFFYCLP